MPTRLKIPNHEPVEIDEKAYDLAKTLPMHLHQLIRGTYQEISLTVQEIDAERYIVLNAVSHKSCEEHGCDDESCRFLSHHNSVQIPFRKLDEILDEMFYERHRKYPADSPLPK